MRTCRLCNGPLEALGQLGLVRWYRCRNCGMQCSKDLLQRKNRKTDKLTAKAALNLIATQLDGREWSADDLDVIAAILRSAGYQVREPQAE